MAKFNPDEAIPEATQTRHAKFNPAEAIPEDKGINNGPYIPLSSTIPIEAFKGVAKGIGSDVANIGNFLTGGKIPKYNPSGPGVAAGKLAPAFALGPAGEGLAALGIEGAASASPVIDSLASSKVGGAIARLLPSAAGGAAASLGGENPLKDAAEGAAIGAALPPVLSGIANAYPLAKRGIAKLLVGGSENVKPEEFEAARSAIPGKIKAPIGELAKSTRAERGYALAKGAVFSGADAPYSELYDHLTEGVNNLTKAAPSAEGLNDNVYSELSSKYEDAKSKTRNEYDKFSSYADKNNVEFNRNPLDKQLNSSIKELKERIYGKGAKELNKDIRGLSNAVDDQKKDSVILSSRDNLPIKKDASVLGDRLSELKNKYDNSGNTAAKSIFKNLSSSFENGGEKGLYDALKKNSTKNETVQDLYSKSLKSLNDFKKSPINSFSHATDSDRAINDLISKASTASDPDKVFLRHLGKIKSGLNESLDKSAEESKNPEILRMYNNAKDARKYQGTFEKLNERDSTPFYKTYEKNGEPSNLISQYLKPSRANSTDDNYGVLSSLINKLEPDTVKKIAAAHVNPDGQQTLANQLNRIKNLSSKQRNLLFGEDSPNANHLNKISNIYSKSKNANFTPETGYTGSKERQASEIVKEIFKQSKIPAGGAAAGGFLGGIPGAAIGAFAWPAITYGLQKTLRSNALKNEYLKYLRGVSAAPNRVSPLINNAARTALTAPGGKNGS